METASKTRHKWDVVNHYVLHFACRYLLFVMFREKKLMIINELICLFFPPNYNLGVLHGLTCRLMF